MPQSLRTPWTSVGGGMSRIAATFDRSGWTPSAEILLTDGCFRVIQLDVLFLASVLEATEVFRVVLFCLGLSVSMSNYEYDDIIYHTDDSLQPIQCLSETFLKNLTAY